MATKTRCVKIVDTQDHILHVTISSYK